MLMYKCTYCFNYNLALNKNKTVQMVLTSQKQKIEVVDLLVLKKNDKTLTFWNDEFGKVMGYNLIENWLF